MIACLCGGVLELWLGYCGLSCVGLWLINYVTKKYNQWMYNKAVAHKCCGHKCLKTVEVKNT